MRKSNAHYYLYKTKHTLLNGINTLYKHWNCNGSSNLSKNGFQGPEKRVLLCHINV